jgi:hypothetical protein
MYAFALVALLALGTLKLVDYLTETVEPLRSLRSLMTFVIAVAVTVVLDFSLFDAWNVGIDNDGIGPWVTGFMVAGMTVPWRAVFAYLTHDRATSDETLGEHQHIARVA